MFSREIISESNANQLDLRKMTRHAPTSEKRNKENN